MWWAIRWVMGVEESKVRLETLENVIQQNKNLFINLLKIDVEGLELQVLQGLGHNFWHRIKQVAMETSSMDGRQSLIEAILKSNGLNSIRTTAQKTNDNALNNVILLAKREEN